MPIIDDKHRAILEEQLDAAEHAAAQANKIMLCDGCNAKHHNDHACMGKGNITVGGERKRGPCECPVCHKGGKVFVKTFRLT